MSDMNAVHDPADLVALDVLLRRRSVSAAARELGVTQSAMSHTLARLRARFDDPLLVRAGRGLVPTVRAEGMAPRLREAIEALSAAVAAPRFEPAEARRSFRLAMPDYGELVLLPALLPRLAAAPGVDLVVVRAPDAFEALAGGAVDLVIQPRRPEDDRAGLRTRVLFRDGFVCVVRPGHPLAEVPDLDHFVAARHLLVAPRGSFGGIVDDALAARGLRRRTVVAAPSFVAAPYLVARSDLVLTLAERVARLVAPGLGLRVLPHPLELPLFSTSMIWHDRADGDPGHGWLREQLVAAAAELG